MLAKGGLQWAKARDPALIGVLPSLAGAEGRERHDSYCDRSCKGQGVPVISEDLTFVLSHRSHSLKSQARPSLTNHPINLGRSLERDR